MTSDTNSPSTSSPSLSPRTKLLTLISHLGNFLGHLVFLYSLFAHIRWLIQWRPLSLMWIQKLVWILNYQLIIMAKSSCFVWFSDTKYLTDIFKTSDYVVSAMSRFLSSWPTFCFGLLASTLLIQCAAGTVLTTKSK